MLQPIRRAFIVTAVSVSAFVCLETPAVAQDTSPASNAEVYAGTNVTHATATVVDIEVATNSVTLRGSHGDPVDVEVMKNVGDVKRLKIGDNVNITNTRALLVHAGKVDSKGIRESIDTETIMPASGGTTMSVHRAQVIATVESIDATKRGMTLRGPTNSVTLVASASLPLVKLNVGDSIRVDYTESTAVQVTRDGAPLR